MIGTMRVMIGTVKKFGGDVLTGWISVQTGRF